MPNDAPDWAGTIATPAIDLGAFSVPTGTLVTVYNGPTPPGCHAIKVYIQSNDPNNNAQQVTVIDGATAQTIQQFIAPRSTSCVCAIDDVTVPTVRVDVLAAATQLTRCRVVAFLSDQAVAIDNDNSNPVPVQIATIGSTAVPGSGSLPVEIGPRGIPFIAQSGLNAAQSLLLSAPGAPLFNRLSQLMVTWSGATAGAPAVTIVDSTLTTWWEAVVSVPGVGYQPPPFFFPVPLILPGGDGSMSIKVAAAGVAGIASVLTGVYSIY